MVLAALYCSVPPPKVIAPADPSAPAEPTLSWPPLIAVPPVWVLAPVSVRLPPPTLLSKKLPETVADRVVPALVLLTPTEASAVNTTLPPKLAPSVSRRAPKPSELPPPASWMPPASVTGDPVKKKVVPALTTIEADGSPIKPAKFHLSPVTPEVVREMTPDIPATSSMMTFEVFGLLKFRLSVPAPENLLLIVRCMPLVLVLFTTKVAPEATLTALLDSPFFVRLISARKVPAFTLVSPV